MAKAQPSVCIVGAGAAGLSVAWALAAHGWRVTIVEGGETSPRREVEDTYRVKLVGIPHRGAHDGRFRAWGGSTTRWGGQLWAWERHEFAARPLLGIEGWPLGYDEIAPYYDRAFAMLGVKLGTLTPSAAAARGVILPPLDPKQFELRYSTWLPWWKRNLGRGIGASLRKRQGVVAQLGVTATRVILDGTGQRAAGVRVRQRDGSESDILADVVIVAGGTIESIRLLLASERLGDHAGWLGRAFMDHLSVRLARFVPRDRDAFWRMFAPVFVRDLHFTPRMLLRPELVEREALLMAYGHWDVALPQGSALQVVREKLRMLQAGGQFAVSGTEARLLRAGVRDLIKQVRGILFDRRRYFSPTAAIHLRIDTEQRPDPESRIDISHEIDSIGLPRLTLDWRVSDLERRTVKRTGELLGAELDRSGIGVLDQIDEPFDSAREWGEHRGDSFHMMGGSRMARTPGTGVVDADCRVFGTTNVYVASASVFPTGGMANPTLTLVALALRLGDYLARTH